MNRVTDYTPIVFESRIARNGRGQPGEIAPPLKSQSGRSGKGDGAPLIAGPMGGGANRQGRISKGQMMPERRRFPAVLEGVGVRRFTPLECERLQGFPDGWTDSLSDTQRYRMLGDAVCVPTAEWIARRLAAAGG